MNEDRIMAKLDDIHRDLGKIDGRLDEHTAQDAREFAEIEERLEAVVVDQAVAKQAGGASGRTWGALVGGTLIAIAEGVKALVR